MFKEMKKLIIFFFAGMVLVLCSCKKDEESFAPGSNRAINAWIWETMKKQYYWESTLPGRQRIDQDPQSYFMTLLHPQDRFSTILQNQNSETYGYSFENTFGFDFVQYERSGIRTALVTLVVPGSQADQLGLSRGDTLLRLNNLNLSQPIQPSIPALLRSNVINLTRKDGKSFAIASAIIAQPVIYRHAVLEHDRLKYGYLNISHFDFSGGYALLAAIEGFRANGVSELILDLRHNPGGQVSFSAFCALLFTKVKPADVFVEMRGNRKVGMHQLSFDAALQHQPDGYRFRSADLKAKSLNLSRIFILSSGQTASAAELLINNLKPYIDVRQIGQTTMGKDMGSSSIKSPPEVSGKESYSWVLHPLVYKLYNQQGHGDYSTGISPNTLLDEYASDRIFPFGDPQDPMVRAVMEGKVLRGDAGTRSEGKGRVVYERDFVRSMVF